MSEGEDWADRVLAAAHRGPGDDMLDLGDGVGRLAFAAHELVGDGWVIAVDPSVGALEALLRGAHERGAAGIMYLVGDVAVLPLPDGSVDACVASSALARTETRTRRRESSIASCAPAGGCRCSSRSTAPRRWRRSSPRGSRTSPSRPTRAARLFGSRPAAGRGERPTGGRPLCFGS